MPNAEGGYDRVTAEEFKTVLQHDPTWDGKAGLVFIACESAQEFMPKLYELFGRRISMEAPRTLAFISANGGVGTVRRAIDSDGNEVFLKVDTDQAWLTLEKQAD